MRYVLDAIEHHGRCSHKEIVIFVANKIDADPKLASFKKAIHNDIKDLIKDYSIGIDYFTPAGKPIPLGGEDDHKNKRTQYFKIGGEGQIKGGSLLEKVSALFRPQKISSPTWKVANVQIKDFPQNSQICILFRINNKSFSIETERDQLPFKIVVARKDSYIPTAEEIEKEFGVRTSLLLLPWQFISAPKKGDKLGHFVFNFIEDGGQVQMNLTFIQGKSEDTILFNQKKENIEIRDISYHTINNFVGHCQSLTTDIADSFKQDNRISDEPNKYTSTKIKAADSGLKPISIDIGHRFQILITEFHPAQHYNLNKKVS